MPPSSGFLWSTRGAQLGQGGWAGTVLFVSTGTLCNVFIDPSPPHQRKDPTHLSQHATGVGGVRGHVAPTLVIISFSVTTYSGLLFSLT